MGVGWRMLISALMPQRAGIAVFFCYADDEMQADDCSGCR